MIKLVCPFRLLAVKSFVIKPIAKKIIHFKTIEPPSHPLIKYNGKPSTVSNS